MQKIVVYIVAAILSLAFQQGVSAQSLDAFKHRLAEPALSGSVVTVSESEDAAEALQRATRSKGRLTIRGYRVCVFFDNGEDARAGAVRARSLLQENFPEVKSYMVYENPYFKVTVGNCLTAEEAIVLKGKMLSLFPKAFVKNEALTLSDFLNK